ncbi:LuxR C-terminal-related transcriptional regulator [Ruania alba]|uniref:Regulatory protein, luxR family n=1 Tax=Ruania alba TaxID=648782 RepID=A0A1H5KNF3_9MICO|nr:LuxR C-terminal-related transcriptional regulator [Ruania alba]SEE66409.1 regulatory protein, luxR family [Ruania alba]
MAGRSVVVHGEAGTGKTHLITTALRDGLPPAWTLIDLTAGTGGTASWQRLVGEAGARDGVEAGAAALQDWLMLPPAGRALLRLEDAHLLEDTVLAAIALVTHRADVAVVASHSAHPSELTALTGLRDAVTIRVAPMNATQTETMLTEMLGGFPTADAVHRLWLASRGNPFYLSELVRDHQQRGDLFAHDGVWVWTGIPTLTDRMIEAAFHDLGALTEAERDAVERAAVAGVITAATVPHEVRRRLLRRGLLRPGPTGPGMGGQSHLEVTHPLRADAIAAQVSTTRRHDLIAGGQTTPVPTGPQDLVRSVCSRVRAEIPVPLPELLRACHHVVRADEPQTAVELTGAVLQQGIDPISTIKLLTARATAHLRLGDIDAALSDLATARSAMILTDESGAEVLDAYLPAIRHETTVRHFLATDPEATLSVLSSTARWLRPTAQANSLVAQALTNVESLRLAHLAWAGRHPEMLDEAWSRLQHSPHPEQVVQLVGPASIALALAGRSGSATALFERFLPVVSSDRVLRGWDPGSFTLLRFFLLVLTGETDAAERTEPVAGTDVDMVGWHLRRGTVASARGDWATARRELRAANVRLRVRDTLGVVAYSLAQEAKVAAASGDGVAARALLSELATTPRRCSYVTGAYLDLHVVDALIWLRDPSVTEVTARLMEAAARDHQHAIELEAMHRLVVVAGPSAAQAVIGVPLAERVAALAEHVDGRRNEAVVAHLRAILGNRARAVSDTAEHLRELGVILPVVVKPTRLTRREREVAALAAGGMTSKAIAQRLVLSVRTVDSHLAGAYRKLRVHTREGLSGALTAADR